MRRRRKNYFEVLQFVIVYRLNVLPNSTIHTTTLLKYINKLSDNHLQRPGLLVSPACPSSRDVGLTVEGVLVLWSSRQSHARGELAKHTVRHFDLLGDEGR